LGSLSPDNGYRNRRLYDIFWIKNHRVGYEPSVRSEKIPGELAASIKALYNDSKGLPIDDEVTSSMRIHIKALLHAINSNFRKNNWDLHEINSTMDRKKHMQMLI